MEKMFVGNWLLIPFLFFSSSFIRKSSIQRAMLVSYKISVSIGIGSG